MNNFTIHFVTEQFISNNFGGFRVQIGDFDFPDEVWTDFGERVIFSWEEQLTKLFSKQDKKAQCKFIDGNYRFDVETTESPEQLNLVFIKEKRNHNEIERQERVSTEQFFQEILRVIEEIQNKCEKNGNYDAVDRIEESIKRFVKARTHFTT